ncbi:MAG: hypothetical protein ABSC63_19200 [Candidatus Binataceae bacterium]|jgi:hypothetical protein
MAQFAFYVAGAATGVGAMGLLFAWDRDDRGPDAADSDDSNANLHIGLYTWIGLTTGAQLMKIKSKAPIAIPAGGCPSFPDGSPDHDYVTRFEVKPGGTVISAIVDISLELFDDSTRVYGVAPDGKTLKIELADGSFGLSAFSVQDRLTLQNWEDPLDGWAKFINADISGKELWRELMIPDQPLKWL